MYVPKTVKKSDDDGNNGDNDEGGKDGEGSKLDGTDTMETDANTTTTPTPTTATPTAPAPTPINKPKITAQALKQGHDSIEDATTALRLVTLKIKNGPNYGVKGVNLNDRVALSQFFEGTGENGTYVICNMCI